MKIGRYPWIKKEAYKVPLYREKEEAWVFKYQGKTLHGVRIDKQIEVIARTIDVTTLNAGPQ